MSWSRSGHPRCYNILDVLALSSNAVLLGMPLIYPNRWKFSSDAYLQKVFVLPLFLLLGSVSSVWAHVSVFVHRADSSGVGED